MERRSSSHLHFIKAIRSGRVEKVCNTDSYGKPGLVFKALKDVYDSESNDINLGKRKKIEIDSENFDIKSENDDQQSDSDDINFGKITLKQLKKRGKAKKKKVAHSYSLSVKREYAESQLEEDEIDLKETIKSWKSKVSNKTKSKKRIPKKYSPITSPVTSEQMLISEDSLQSSVVGLLLSPVKVEVSVEDSETLYMISEVCDFSLICSEEIISETTEAVENDPDSRSQLSCREGNEICVLNEVYYDHLENIEDDVIMECMEQPFPQLDIATYSEDGESSISNSIPGEVLPEHLSTKDSVLDISIQGNQISNEVLPVTNECTTSDLCKLNNNICQNTPSDLKHGFLNNPLENCNSSMVSSTCSNHEIMLVCGEDDLFLPPGTPVTSVNADVEMENSRNNSPAILLDVSATIEENQCPSSPSDNKISKSPDRNQHKDSVFDISVPVTENHCLMGPCHSPGRILSTRKVISPISQERLCQAMKSEELLEDVDNYKPKVKLHFVNVTKNESLTDVPCAENTKAKTHLQELGAAKKSKVIMRPKRSTIKKNSPPKGNQKSSDISRSLPNFSSGTRSLQKCSESAIAFSQRQMHDFECLTTKLINELNSMKDIVEGKLLSETFTMEISKNDVDEVKRAVKSVKRTEETTTKWLSMMTRDCNRFCTIMVCFPFLFWSCTINFKPKTNFHILAIYKTQQNWIRLLQKLSEKGELASPNKIRKERRKIIFADEAGGLLCHVKVFDDDLASLNSPSQSQSSQSEV